MNIEDGRDEFVRDYDREFDAAEEAIAKLAEALINLADGKRARALTLLKEATQEDWSGLTVEEIVEGAADERRALQDKLATYDPDGAWAEEAEARAEEEAYVHMIQVESIHW